MAVQISIDGYAACGKSTLARGLADKLGFVYIDSGAMYRGITYYFIQENIPFDQAPSAKLMENIDISFVSKQGSHTPDQLLLNGTNVNNHLRSQAVNDKVSTIAAMPSVRKHLVKLQQQYGEKNNVVMDGRDIGNVVFPNAILKLFLTAEIETRIRRRMLDLKADSNLSYEEVKENLLHRDHIDSTRKDSPLRQSPDAVLIDNTNLSIKEQLEMVYTLALLRLKKL